MRYTDPEGYDYTHDINGCRLYTGMYVECRVGFYRSIKYGDRRRIQGIDRYGHLIMLNHLIGDFTSYTHDNFIKHSCHRKQKNPYNSSVARVIEPEQGNESMLHMAIELLEGDNYQTVANVINKSEPDESHNRELIADVTVNALKERIRAKIAHNPERRFLLLSGSTIAETSAPPIDFRQW